MRNLLGTYEPLDRKFLDLGSGSGLMSLAARRLGMRVVSFDYDPSSVACTKALKSQYSPDDEHWTVLEGSILDDDFVRSLGQYDVVYSWGVLHHTGAMWHAIERAAGLVAVGGTLVIAIYNDQGPWSRVWRTIKVIYNRIPSWLRKPFVVLVMVPCELRIAFVPIVKLKPMAYFSRWTREASEGNRGMSQWYDYVDWVGGYPFEVAKPEEVFTFCRGRGFSLEVLKTCAGDHGCNEFVFSQRS